MENWVTPQEFIDQAKMQDKDAEMNLIKVINTLGATHMRLTPQGYEFMWNPSVQSLLPVAIMDEADVKDGWVQLAIQLRKQIVNGLLQQLMELDRETVLDIVQAILEQEEPQKAVDRAVRIAQETAKRVQGVGLQSLMDQAKPTAKFKRE